MQVVLASRNSHKVQEVQRILAEAGAPFELVGLDDLEMPIPDIAETGATFADNAVLKAQAVCDLAQIPALADDSGLMVEALNGMPGVLSARWAGAHGDDAANLQLVLNQMSDVPLARRQAAFVCAVAFARPTEAPIVVEGSVAGLLTTAPRGNNGFGYDPIFKPTGYSQTTAEMASTTKDELSHRGKALRALTAELTKRGLV